MGDWSGALQAAINEGVPLVIPAMSISYTQPLLIGMGGDIEGCGRSTVLMKVGTAVGSGGNVAPARSGITDTYDKNAALIITHPDNNYAFDVSISAMTIRGSTHDVEFGIYAPRTSRMTLSKLYLQRFQKGFTTHDSFLCEMSKVVADCDSRTNLHGQTYGWASGATGFGWLNDGSNNATGTTIDMRRCYAHATHVGYQMYGVSYIAMNNCAADWTSGSPYRFSACTGVAMNGCGAEFSQMTGGGDAVLSVLASRVTASGFRGYAHNGASTGTSAMIRVENGELTMLGSELSDFANPGTAVRDLVQTDGHLYYFGTRRPANGSTFNGFTGGGSIWELSKGVMTRRTSAGIRNVQANGSISADKGDAAATLTASTSERTSVWATPLTADRAVTLSTTGAAHGDSFRIIRRPTATGASLLNVGAGPLKALSAGQWCDVTYDGSAWTLSAAGPL